MDSVSKSELVELTSPNRRQFCVQFFWHFNLDRSALLSLSLSILRLRNAANCDSNHVFKLRRPREFIFNGNRNCSFSLLTLSTLKTEVEKLNTRKAERSAFTAALGSLGKYFKELPWFRLKSNSFLNETVPKRAIKGGRANEVVVFDWMWLVANMTQESRLLKHPHWALVSFSSQSWLTNPSSGWRFKAIKVYSAIIVVIRHFTLSITKLEQSRKSSLTHSIRCLAIGILNKLIESQTKK